MLEWFKSKFGKGKDDDLIVTDVPLSSVYRWFLYDTSVSDDVNDVAEALGLTRVSEEGEEMEKADSTDRLKAVSPLLPYLDTIAEISARTLTLTHGGEITKQALEDIGASEETVENLVDSMYYVYKVIALSTLVGAFSVGLGLGMISHDTIRASLLYTEDEDE